VYSTCKSGPRSLPWGTPASTGESSVYDVDCGAVSGMKEWQRERKYSEKMYPSGPLSTTHEMELGP
jgi:hypothetical protein